MTPEEKLKLDTHFAELTKHEIEFLRTEGNGEKNEHGVYLYASDNGNHMLNMAFFLGSYKSWLIENKIVKEVQ